MSKTKDCISIARQALNLFTDNELESYIKQVSNRTREFQEEGIPFSRAEAIKEINNQHIEAFLSESSTAVLDGEKWGAIESKMNLDVPIRSFLEKTKVNTDYNVENFSHAAKQKLYDKSFGELSKEQLDLLIENESNESIYEAADGIGHHEAKIKDAGQKLAAYIEQRNAALIKSTALQPSEIRADRFFRNTYDASKLLKMGKELFVPTLKKYINLKETFKNTKAMTIDGELDESIIDEIIGNSYDNIVQGNGVLFTKASVARDVKRMERAKHQFYVYKDWRSWGAANKELGQGSLMDAWMSDIEKSSRYTGMAQVLGSNPELMYNKMREVEVAKKPNTGLNSISYQQNDALFKYQLGINKSIYSPTIANIGNAARQISSMARLFKIVLTSIPDVASLGGMAQRAGMGFWQPMVNRIVHIVDFLPSEERKLIAKQFGAALNTNMGVIARANIEATNVGGSINKFSNKFFHMVGLDAYDKANKIFAMEPVMKGYGRDSNKAFHELNNQQQSFLRRFNINDIEWDALRSKTEKGIFSLDNINSMTNDEIRQLWNNTDKTVPLSEYQSSLYAKVFGMFDVMHEFSVLNPTDYIKMVSTANLQAGTLGGEAYRAIAQFKSYPIQYMRRIISGGMQDFDSYQSKIMYGLNMATATIGLTMLAEALISISKGYTPPNPVNMSNGERAKYLIKMLAGGMGVFSSILNDNDNAKEMTLSMFWTPSLRLAVDPIATAISLAKGDLKGAKRNARDFANVASPIATAPIVSPFIDSMLGNKPYLEPGQHPIF